jgi:predicted fused transcriptional regulator/phosphomethylpyrimidine kinase
MPIPKVKQIIKPWTLNHQKKENALFSTTQKLNLGYNKETFIQDHKKELFKLIRDNKDWKDGTKEGYFFTVARKLFNINNKDRYTKLFSDAGFQLMQTTKEKEGNNELDEKEQENFRTHQYFLNLISTLETTTNISKTEHLKQLLLKLLVLQPPLRTSFYTSAIITNSKQDNDPNYNYVYFNRRGSHKAFYIVNKDKASNYKIYAINKNLSKIELSKEATEAIIESYQNYPRNYLFEIDNKPITDGTFLKWLRDITGLSNINVDMMRASYITWFHDTNPKFGDREKLAKIMRHSQQTASQNYRKILNTEQRENKNCDEVNKKLVILEQANRELNNKLKAYQENKEDIRKYKKRRRDIIYQLNKNGREPRQDTLTRYNIKLNTDTKIYY